MLSRLSVVLASVSIAWFLYLLNRDVEAGDFARISTAYSRVDAGPGWFDPRWQEELAARLAPLGELRTDDRAALERLVLEIARLPFVRETGAPQVLWPDGLRVAVRFREPVACLHAGRQFLGIAADGVLLPGSWPTPPARGSGFLPVIIPRAGALAGAVPGSRVAEPSVADALAIAASLWESLSSEALARLGRIVIDARRARLATVEEPGAVLWLENARRVLFGRSPNLDAPGELPVATKWTSLTRALELLDPGETCLDWELADVRWDRPDLLPRGGLGARASAGAGD